MSITKTQPKKRRSGPSGPTQSEHDREAAGRVQMKLRVKRNAANKLDELVGHAGKPANRSTIVEELIDKRHASLKPRKN